MMTQWGAEELQNSLFCCRSFQVSEQKFKPFHCNNPIQPKQVVSSLNYHDQHFTVVWRTMDSTLSLRNRKKSLQNYVKTSNFIYKENKIFPLKVTFDFPQGWGELRHKSKCLNLSPHLSAFSVSQCTGGACEGRQREKGRRQRGDVAIPPSNSEHPLTVARVSLPFRLRSLPSHW